MMKNVDNNDDELEDNMEGMDEDQIKIHSCCGSGKENGCGLAGNGNGLGDCSSGYNVIVVFKFIVVMTLELSNEIH